MPVSSIVPTMSAETVTENVLREDLSTNMLALHKKINDFYEAYLERSKPGYYDDESVKAGGYMIEERKQLFGRAGHFFEKGDDYELYKEAATEAAELIVTALIKRYENDDLPDEVYPVLYALVELKPYVQLEL